MKDNTWGEYINDCSLKKEKELSSLFDRKYTNHTVYWEGRIKKINEKTLDLIINPSKSLSSKADIRLLLLKSRIKKSSDLIQVGKSLKFRGIFLGYRL